MGAVRGLLIHLRELGIVAGPTQPEASPLDRVAEEFATFLSKERALSPATVSDYCSTARMLMGERFATGAIHLAKLRVVDIREFVLRHAHSYCPKRVQTVLTALRSFLRFLYLQGQIPIPLADHVPKATMYPPSVPPKWLPDDAIEKILASCDRRSATGRRDYAILMLLARLGLRAGEVLHMELDDIRWAIGEIMVCGKGRQRKRFPLPEDVGQAISAYLKDGRPPFNSRRVFLCARAPYRELALSSSLVAIVRRAFLRSGVASPSKGAHVFRHSLATSMLQKGATLTEIGQILHHKNPDTTAIYAKVDINGLRTLARPWPGDKP